VVLFIAPFRERRTYRRFVIGGLMMVVLLAFRLLSTTVLAKPAVAQIEEVCGLVHNLPVSFVL
jgi:choline-glycine betaine transporter